MGMTYALLLVGLLFVGIVLFLRVRNHMNYCRRVSGKSDGEKIPGCPDFDPIETKPSTENGEEPRSTDQHE